MKKILLFLFCAAGLFLTAACHQNEAKFDDGNIYFFYQTTCPHCHDAAGYFNTKYPDVKILRYDIKLPGNMKLFEQALRHYNIKGPAGTPLICMGRHYIMGWGANETQLFDLYVKDYME